MFGALCFVAFPVLVALKLSNDGVVGGVTWFVPLAFLWFALCGTADLGVHSMSLRKLRSGVTSPLWADAACGAGYAGTSVLLAVFAQQGKVLLAASLYSSTDSAGSSDSAAGLSSGRVDFCSGVVSFPLSLSLFLSFSPSRFLILSLARALSLSLCLSLFLSPCVCVSISVPLCFSCVRMYQL